MAGVGISIVLVAILQAGLKRQTVADSPGLFLAQAAWQAHLQLGFTDWGHCQHSHLHFWAYLPEILQTGVQSSQEPECTGFL